MARTAEDTALLLQAMAGPDPGDPRQRDVPRADYVAAVERAGTDLSGLRIGIVTEGFSEGVGAEPATCDAVRAAAERLAGLGAELYERSLPEHLQAGGIAFAGFVEGMTALMTSGGNGIGWRGRYWEELAPAIVAGLRERGNELSPQVKTVLAAGVHLREHLGGAPYARAQNLRPVAARGLRPGARRHRRPAHADHAVPRLPAGRRAAHERARPARLGEPGQHVPDRHVRASRDLAAARARPTACRSASCSSGTTSTTRGCSRSRRRASARSAGPVSPSSARRT